MSSSQNGSRDQRNGLGDDPQSRLIRSPFRALVQDFEPIWFSWCMNFGIIAILLHEYNYQFPGIQVLATICFVCDFVLFIIFSVIFLLRLVWFRAQAYNELVDTLASLPMLACWPIAWLTLISFVGLTVSQAYWGGHAFTIVSYVMWWFGAVFMTATLLFIYLVTINRANLADQDLTAAIVVPAVGLSTLATVGGLITSFATDMSAGLSVPIIVASFCATGAALIMGIMLYGFVLHQLLVKGWPPAPLTATVFMFVGPTGQISTALQTLGSAASTYNKFEGYNKGTFLTKMAAMPLDVICVLLGLLLTGMGAIWLFMAFYAMIYRAVRKELVWNPTWNAIIFPTGTLASSTLELGIALDSAFFKVVAGIFIVFLVLVLVTNFGFTVWKIAKGELLIVREDWRVKKEMEEEQKER